jgi:hypothetical protein
MGIKGYHFQESGIVPVTQMSLKISSKHSTELLDILWRTITKIPSRPDAFEEREWMAEISSLRLKELKECVKKDRSFLDEKKYMDEILERKEHIVEKLYYKKMKTILH